MRKRKKQPASHASGLLSTHLIDTAGNVHDVRQFQNCPSPYSDQPFSLFADAGSYILLFIQQSIAHGGTAMQIIAMLTMLIDHIGILFFPGNDAWRIIGRVAFPIYAYFIVLGYYRTRDVNRYLRRLVLLAALSQVPFMLGLATLKINVIGTLAVCLAVLVSADRYPRWTLGFAVAGAFALEALPFDYGFYALALICIYRYLDRKYWIIAHFALNVLAFALDSGWWVQAFSIIPSLFLVYRDTLFAEFKLGVAPPRWLWRSFYPAHLAVLAAVVAITEGNG